MWHPRAALLYPSLYCLNLGVVELYVGGGVETVPHTFPVQMPTAAHVRNRRQSCVIDEHLPRVVSIHLKDPFLGR